MSQQRRVNFEQKRLRVRDCLEIVENCRSLSFLMRGVQRDLKANQPYLVLEGLQRLSSHLPSPSSSPSPEDGEGGNGSGMALSFISHLSTFIQSSIDDLLGICFNDLTTWIGEMNSISPIIGQSILTKMLSLHLEENSSYSSFKRPTSSSSSSNLEKEERLTISQQFLQQDEDDDEHEGGGGNGMSSPIIYETDESNISSPSFMLLFPEICSNLLWEVWKESEHIHHSYNLIPSSLPPSHAYHYMFIPIIGPPPPSHLLSDKKQKTRGHLSSFSSSFSPLSDEIIRSVSMERSATNNLSKDVENEDGGEEGEDDHNSIFIPDDEEEEDVLGRILEEDLGAVPDDFTLLDSLPERFSPIHRCLYVYSQVNAGEELKGEYLTQRCVHKPWKEVLTQLKGINTLSSSSSERVSIASDTSSSSSLFPNLGTVESIFNAIFGVCGFFIIELLLRKNVNPEVGDILPSSSDIGKLWEEACRDTIQFIIYTLSSPTTPPTTSTTISDTTTNSMKGEVSTHPLAVIQVKDLLLLMAEIMKDPAIVGSSSICSPTILMEQMTRLWSCYIICVSNHLKQSTLDVLHHCDYQKLLISTQLEEEKWVTSFSLQKIKIEEETRGNRVKSVTISEGLSWVGGSSSTSQVMSALKQEADEEDEENGNIEESLADLENVFKQKSRSQSDGHVDEEKKEEGGNTIDHITVDEPFSSKSYSFSSLVPRILSLMYTSSFQLIMFVGHLHHQSPPTTSTNHRGQTQQQSSKDLSADDADLQLTRMATSSRRWSDIVCAEVGSLLQDVIEL